MNRLIPSISALCLFICLASCQGDELVEVVELTKPKIERTFYLEDNGEENGRKEYFYNSEGLLVETQAYYKGNPTWNRITEYNAEGMEVKNTTYNTYQTSTNYFEYNSNNQIAKYSTFKVNHDTNGVEGYKEQWYTEYFYEDDKLSLVKHSDGRYSEYTYPKINRKVIKTYNSDDFLTGKSKVFYKNGLVVKDIRKRFTDYENSENNKWETLFEYNENHHLLTKTTNGFLTEQNTYEGLKLVKKELFFDLSGSEGLIFDPNPNRYIVYEY
ncbi:MAG: hypothetical protein ACPGLV_00180 [Bacteroidia bacterium]